MDLVSEGTQKVFPTYFGESLDGLTGVKALVFLGTRKELAACFEEFHGTQKVFPADFVESQRVVP